MFFLDTSFLCADVTNCFLFQNILYEIIAGLRNVSADAPSSSAAPRCISSTKSVGELLTDIAPVCNVNF